MTWGSKSYSNSVKTFRVWILLQTRVVFALGEEMAQKQIKLETPPFDARFPNTNQTRNCWQNYVDYHKCIKAKGEGYEPCEYFKRVYTSLCPHAWVSLHIVFSNVCFIIFLNNAHHHIQVEDWDEQREQGSFPGKI